jgi:uncharacterized protein (DUF305 family)
MHTNPRAAVSAGALTLLLTLAGCTAGDAPTPDTDTDPMQEVTLPAGVIQADVDFAQMMIVHHRDALAMAELAQGRTTNPAVLDLADRIATAQQPEIDQMSAMLDQWGAEVPRGTEMAPMDGSDAMPGAMSEQQLSGLSDAEGEAFDESFLSLMIEHHSGAVTAAEDLLATDGDAEARRLAESIRTAQTAEIAEMRALLAS